jgi:hypothetical protein
MGPYQHNNNTTTTTTTQQQEIANIKATRIIKNQLNSGNITTIKATQIN